jgi:hypothetical protein
MSKHVKKKLKVAGWSYRAAAARLGVTYQHLCLVLNGRRSSRRLLAALATLPTPASVRSRKSPSHPHSLSVK